MIIFCPKDGDPDQLICPEVRSQFFVLGVGGLKKCRPPPLDFFSGTALDRPLILEVRGSAYEKFASGRFGRSYATEYTLRFPRYGS